MECINIRVNNGRVDVTVDGAKLTDVHSVSVDYIKKGWNIYVVKNC